MIMCDSVSMIDVIIRRVFYTVRDFSDCFEPTEVSLILAALDELKSVRNVLNAFS